MSSTAWRFDASPTKPRARGPVPEARTRATSSTSAATVWRCASNPARSSRVAIGFPAPGPPLPALGFRDPAPGSRLPARLSGTEPLLDVGELERVHQRLDVTIHHGLKVVCREADAMIRDSALRKVVCPDLRRAV